MQLTNSVMPLKANNQVICILSYFQAEYTRDMEEHAHGAGDSTHPAAPRVGTLHALPPNIVRLLDLQNSITVYLQGCLAYKPCSTSGLNCRYLNLYIKLKLIGLAIRLYQKFWKKNKLLNFSWLLNVSAQITFWTLHVKANFVFRLFNVFLSFWAKALKNVCAISVKKLQNIFEKRFIKYGVIIQKSQTSFYLLNVKLATVQIWERSNKFPLTCSSLKCLLVKKLFRENSAEKICLLCKQTPPTNTDNWVLR